MNKFQVIATLNSHLLNRASLESLRAHGATIFRINGAHIQPAELERYSTDVRAILGNRINLLVDLPGNKIRTAVLSQPIILRAGATFELLSSQVNYPPFLAELAAGDVLVANDSLFTFTVESSGHDRATLRSRTDGTLTSNKGIHLLGKTLDLPFLFERDRELIASAIRNDMDYVGFSFVRVPADVVEAQASLSGTGVRALVKVETSAAVEHLDAILDLADEFLVDRGDLSCDVGIEHIDRVQKLILRRAKARGKSVYFATQFLHSMLENSVPLIAEACGLADAIRSGVDGIQLSEETAIGKHPVEVLRVVERALAATEPFARLAGRSRPSPVLWLTGRSGSGKTTLANGLLSRLESAGVHACVIDGDDFRAFWNNDVGYSRDERMRNQRNMIFTAFQASQVFDLVIVSSLSPYRELRDFARSKIQHFHEVYVDCPTEVCQARDPKGHYKKAAGGGHEHFVGVTEEYEVPARPELTVDTSIGSLDASVSVLLHYLRNVTQGAGVEVH